MTIQSLAHHGQSNRAVARLLGVSEGAVRYHRRRQAEGAGDGRGEQAFTADGYHAAIVDWLEACDRSRRARLRPRQCCSRALRARPDRLSVERTDVVEVNVHG